MQRYGLYLELASRICFFYRLNLGYPNSFAWAKFCSCLNPVQFANTVNRCVVSFCDSAQAVAFADGVVTSWVALVFPQLLERLLFGDVVFVAEDYVVVKIDKLARVDWVALETGLEVEVRTG